MDSVARVDWLDEEFMQERADALATHREEPVHWYVALVALQDAQDLVRDLVAVQAIVDAPMMEMLAEQADALYAVQRDAVRLVAAQYPDGDALWSRLDDTLPHSLVSPDGATSLRIAVGMIDGWRREAGQRMDNDDRTAFRKETMALSELAALQQAEAEWERVTEDEAAGIAKAPAIEADPPLDVIDASFAVQTARDAYEHALADRHWLAWLGYSGAEGHVTRTDVFRKTVQQIAASQPEDKSSKVDGRPQIEDGPGHMADDGGLNSFPGIVSVDPVAPKAPRKKPGTKRKDVPYNLACEGYFEMSDAYDGAPPVWKEMRDWLRERGHPLSESTWKKIRDRWEEQGLPWPPVRRP